MNLINFLKSKEYIVDMMIHDFKEFRYGYFIKIQCIFNNGFEFHIKEYVDENSRNYSFHLQDSDSKFIARWDNAPHHKSLKSYPHHFHQFDEVYESYDITYDEIFSKIETLFLTL